MALKEQAAMAERWHYMQSVLERRRQQSRSLRQLYIRQPIENMMKSKQAANQANNKPSILKKHPHTQHERAPNNKQVRFATGRPSSTTNQYDAKDAEQEQSLQPDLLCRPATTWHSNDNKLPKLGQYQDPATLKSPRTPTGADRRQDQMSNYLLPLLNANNGDVGDSGDASDARSWVERQFAKIKQRKQRKLWTIVNGADNEGTTLVATGYTSSNFANEDDASLSSGHSFNDVSLYLDDADDDDADAVHEHEDVVSSSLPTSPTSADVDSGRNDDEGRYRGWAEFPAEIAASIDERRRRRLDARRLLRVDGVKDSDWRRSRQSRRKKWAVKKNKVAEKVGARLVSASISASATQETPAPLRPKCGKSLKDEHNCKLLEKSIRASDDASSVHWYSQSSYCNKPPTPPTPPLISPLNNDHQTNIVHSVEPVVEQARANSRQHAAGDDAGDATGDDADTIGQCRCVHRAILSCLLPEALNDAVASIDVIRQQLRKTRLRQNTKLWIS